MCTTCTKVSRIDVYPAQPFLAAEMFELEFRRESPEVSRKGWKGKKGKERKGRDGMGREGKEG